MRDLVNQDYLNIINSGCVEVTEIRTEDDVKVLLEELENIILGAERSHMEEFPNLIICR